MQQIEVSEPWFSCIKNGTKTVEGRKATPKWLSLRPGQRVLVANSGDLQDTFYIDIVRLQRYDTLSEMFDREGLHNVLPGIGSNNEGEQVYLDFWSQSEIDEYGMVGIKVQVS